MLWPPITVQPASTIFEKPAGQNLPQNLQVRLFPGNTNRQRGQRASAHRIYVAQRIHRRNLPEGERSSTIGVKKSTVCTSASSGEI